MIIKRALSQEQTEKIAAREKPSAEDILKAQDQLFMYLLQKVEELEERDSDG